MKSTIDSVSDCDLLVQSVIYHDLNVVHLFVNKKQIVYQKFTKIQSSSRCLIEIYRSYTCLPEKSGKIKKNRLFVAIMAPFALCTSMSQRGDAVAHGRAHEGNWQPQAPHRHPMDVWKLMARLVRWQQKSLPTKNLPNLISKGLVFYFQPEGDEIPNLDSPW